MAFFSRAWSLEISRGRLARQAPAYGWARTAGRSQRGTQSTRAAVNADGCQGGGGHYCRQPSLKEADRNIVFPTPIMKNIRLWTQGLVNMRWALIYDAWMS